MVLALGHPAVGDRRGAPPGAERAVRRRRGSGHAGRREPAASAAAGDRRTTSTALESRLRPLQRRSRRRWTRSSCPAARRPARCCTWPGRWRDGRNAARGRCVQVDPDGTNPLAAATSTGCRTCCSSWRGRRTRRVTCCGGRAATGDRTDRQPGLAAPSDGLATTATETGKARLRTDASRGGRSGRRVIRWPAGATRARTAVRSAPARAARARSAARRRYIGRSPRPAGSRSGSVPSGVAAVAERERSSRSSARDAPGSGENERYSGSRCRGIGPARAPSRDRPE